MSTSIKFLIIISVLCCSSISKAQDSNTTTYAKFPLKVAIGNHAVGFLYQNSFDSFNPSFSVGTEKGLNKNLKHHLFLPLNLGFVRNKVIGNTVTIDLGFGYRYTHSGGIYLETNLGLGVLNQFHPREIYIQNATDGTYEKATNSGKFATLVGLRTGIGYDFSKKSDAPWRIGLSHNFFIQAPYFAVMSFPIMPQSTTNISLSYRFKKS